MLIWVQIIGLFFSTITAQDDPQAAREFIELAEEVMRETKALDQAREMYVQAVQFDPNNIEANYMAGELFLQTINKERASRYFEKVLELDPTYRFDIPYKIGYSYQLGYDFREAINYYNQYKNKLISTSDYQGEDFVPIGVVDRRIEECRNGIQFMSDPKEFSIVNAGRNVNSPWPDYAPMVNADETVMVFTTRRKQGNANENVFEDNLPYEDIFITKKEGGEWGPAKNIGAPVNTLFFDSNLALSSDGKQLFIYVDDNGGDIFVAEELEDGSWSDPLSISEEINSTYEENSFTISPNGKYAFFTSDRPGGLGGIDIYLALRDDEGNWSQVTNVGSEINTPDDDYSPYIDFDGKTLYFSSRGGKGMGGYDIFRSTYDSTSQSWSTPENLGYPINTPDNDVFFVTTADGKRGYYASVREDGMGYEDIYTVSIPERTPDPQKQALSTVEEKPKVAAENVPVELTLTIKDDLTSELINADVSIRSQAENVVVAVNQQSEGEYVARFSNEKPMNYMISVEKEGYAFQNFSFGVPPMANRPQRLARTVRLKPLNPGTRAVLRNIYFDFNKTSFKDASYTELNKLESMLANNPDIRMEISGHTDNVGSKEYNQSLSERRAQAVVNYLQEKGIDSRRLIAVGYGETQPLASNDDEREGREINRRVEFKVLE